MGEKKSCLLWTEDAYILVRGHKGDDLKHLRCFKTSLTTFRLQIFSSWVRPGTDPQSTGFGCWQGTIKDFWTADWFMGFGYGQSHNPKWFQGTVAWDKSIAIYMFTSEIVFHVSSQAWLLLLCLNGVRGTDSNPVHKFLPICCML